MQNQIHLLKSKRFLPLFITQFLGAFNDNLFKNAFLIWVVYEISQKSEINAQFIVTLASGLFILPFFIFSALAGQISDKYEKSGLVRKIKIFEIILMSLVFLGFYLEDVNFILFLVFLMGIQSTFFGPIKYSLLPEHLKDDELISGNAIIEAGTFLAILFGTIIGSIFILKNNGTNLISALVLFIAITGWLSSKFIPKSPISDKKLKINFNIFSSTIEIINHTRKQNNIWLVIIAISWFWFIGLAFLSQFPTYSRNIINGNEYIVTLFLSIFSIGIGIGSTLCNKLLKGKINARLVPYGCFGITTGIFIFCLASYFYQTPENVINVIDFIFLGICSWLIIVGLLLIAIFSGIYIVPLYAIMQHKSEDSYISRTIAANNILNALFMVLCSIFIILLSNLGIKLLEIFIIISLLNIVVFFIIKKIIKKEN